MTECVCSKCGNVHDVEMRSKRRLQHRWGYYDERAKAYRCLHRCGVILPCELVIAGRAFSGLGKWIEEHPCREES